MPDHQHALRINTLHNSNVVVTFLPLLKTGIVPKPARISVPQSVEKKVPQVAQEIPPKPPKPLPQKKVVPSRVSPKPVVKPAVQKKPVPQKKVVKPEPEKKVITPPAVKPEEVKKVEKKITEPVTNTVQPVIVGREDKELMDLSDTLKQTIMKSWKRPSNIPTTLVCEVCVILNKDGTRDVTIKKPSHALALDMSARNFLLEYEFPPHAFGKELTILF